MTGASYPFQNGAVWSSESGHARTLRILAQLVTFFVEVASPYHEFITERLGCQLLSPFSRKSKNTRKLNDFILTLLWNLSQVVKGYNTCSRNGWTEDTDLVPCLFESCEYPGEIDEDNPIHIHRDRKIISSFSKFMYRS